MGDPHGLVEVPGRLVEYGQSRAVGRAIGMPRLGGLMVRGTGRLRGHAQRQPGCGRNEGKLSPGDEHGMNTSSSIRPARSPHGRALALKARMLRPSLVRSGLPGVRLP